jgi:hypothetical protein
VKAAICPETRVGEIPSEVDAIHLVRPIGWKKLEKILGKCGNCVEASMSKSCFERLPAKTRGVLEKRGVRIRVESKRGRAIGISLEKMLHAIELRRDYQSLREVERITAIPKSTVHYLEKYAGREKIKKGNTTIYLK